MKNVKLEENGEKISLILRNETRRMISSKDRKLTKWLVNNIEDALNNSKQQQQE